MNYTLFVIRDYIVGWVTVPMLVYFATLMWIKRTVPKPWVYPLYILAIPFIILDFLYQVFIGTWIFWDKPKHWLFTDRLQEYDKDPSMKPFVDRFKRALNENDPDHV